VFTVRREHPASSAWGAARTARGQPELEQHFAVVDAVQRFNDSKTGWRGRYEAVRVLASELDEGALTPQPEEHRARSSGNHE